MVDVVAIVIATEVIAIVADVVASRSYSLLTFPWRGSIDSIGCIEYVDVVIAVVVVVAVPVVVSVASVGSIVRVRVRAVRVASITNIARRE